MKTNYEIVWLTSTTAKVFVGLRTESFYKGASTGRWVATFNGIAREFKAKNEALKYAIGA